MKNGKFLAVAGLLLLTILIIPYQAKATTDFGIISIANPDNTSEGITIMDRNLGATSNDMTSKDSFGYHFQWGNNYGFPQGCFSEGCSDSVTEASRNVETDGAIWNDSYNNSGYYGTKFIKHEAFYDSYRKDGSFHNGLRGGTGDNPSNNWGANQNNSEDRQGPCPDGYHVPSAGEWGLLVKYWGNTYAKDNLVNGGDGFYYISGDAKTDFKIYFKLPYAGGREDDEATLYGQGEYGEYWSSSPNGNAYPDDWIGESRRYYFSLNGMAKWNYMDSTRGLSVRCFKNTYEPRTQEDTKTIRLEPGLNTFSTPAILKSISFSNGGNNITFSKMEKGERKAMTVNNSNVKNTVKPLEGYIIRNSNSSGIDMTIEYDTDNSDSLTLSKNLDAGRNFLGITKINNPFNDIANTTATMILDFTNGENTNLIQIGKTFINATIFTLGKAYAVFVNNPNGIYGGINYYDGGDNGDDYQCVSMDTANVTHTIEDGIITIKWDEIQGDFVSVSKYIDEERGYVGAGNPISTVSMKNKKFEYKIERSGEHKFKLRNGCKNFYYTVNVSLEQAYPQELQDAYERAYENGIITNTSIDNAGMYYPLHNNIELADIMNRFAENILGLKPNTGLNCPFDDISSYTQVDQETLTEYQEIIEKSCQLGLMPRDKITNPAPFQDVNRAVFGTALSRAFRKNLYTGGNPYYINHLNALQDAGIMSQINDPENRREIKGYVLLMLMRGTEYNCDINGDGEINKNDLTAVNKMISDDLAGNGSCDKKICDLNRDGQISVTDMMNIKKCVGRNNNPTHFDRCDINEDGEINYDDQQIISDHVNNGGTICTLEKCDLNGDHDITIDDVIYNGCEWSVK